MKHENGTTDPTGFNGHFRMLLQMLNRGAVIVFLSAMFLCGCFSRQVWERPGDPAVITDAKTASEFYDARELKIPGGRFPNEPKDYETMGVFWRSLVTPIIFVGDIIMVPLTFPIGWLAHEEYQCGQWEYWVRSQYDLRYRYSTLRFRIGRDWTQPDKIK